MRRGVVLCIIGLALLTLSATTRAQNDNNIGPGWLTCPRCQSQQDRVAARTKDKVAEHPFNPHDISGVWGNNGMELDLNTLPPLTAGAMQQYAATQAELSAEGGPLSNS